jgi:hypothetical protein
MLGSAAAAGQTTVGEVFRGLLLRTHPDHDAAGSQVYLQHADEIVMHDGVRVENWDALSADIGKSGAGGLDAGSETPSTWYEIHAIRSSRDGNRNLLLHRARHYAPDQSQRGTSGTEALADTADRMALGQTFQVGVEGRVEFVDVHLRKTGAPAGVVWLAIESDGAEGPSAVSTRVDAARLPAAATFVRFVFRTPPTLRPAREYRLVLRGNFPQHASNNVSWSGERSNVYQRGAAQQHNGSSWTETQTVGDFAFTVYVTQNDGPVVMPAGYDQRAKIGYVYNNEGSSFTGFVAMNREVMPLSWAGTGDFGNTTPSLFDLRAFIPPGPIRLELSAADTQAPNRVIGGPVPTGFDARASDFNRGEGGQVSVLIAVPSDAQSMPMGRIITEYQAAYFFTTGGRARVYLSMWAW